MDITHKRFLSRSLTHQSKKHSKIIIFLLKKIITKTIKQSFNRLNIYSHLCLSKLNKLNQIFYKYESICVRISWNKIQIFSHNSKHKNRILKNISILFKNIQKSIIKSAFLNIRNCQLSRFNQKEFFQITRCKNIILFQSLIQLFQPRKIYAFNKLKHQPKKQKQKNPTKTITTILNALITRTLLSVLSKLMQITPQNSHKIPTTITNLNTQLKSIKSKIQTKTSVVTKLQQQLQHLKQNSINKSAKQSNNNSFYHNSPIISRNGSFKLKSYNSSFQKDSSDTNSIYQKGSIRSLLGISILSNRSKSSYTGRSNNSRNQQCTCLSCIYRQKYQKYKAMNNTLKKQLSLIKQQLQFINDMNEHIQNEIKTTSIQINNNHASNLEQLKIELKQNYKQRDILRDKIFKYEKYEGKLKKLFKFKISTIYQQFSNNS